MTQPAPTLTPQEGQWLLRLARQALEAGVRGQPLPAIPWEQLPPRLKAPGTTFVSLYREGLLRGCVGTLEPQWPLAEDVRVHTLAAALEDPRFPPVTPEELPHLTVEVSVLSPLQPLEVGSPQELLERLRPGQDGLVLENPHTGTRATFLPQVWEKLPDPKAFLSHLCVKAGLPPDAWLRQPLRYRVYQVEKWRENPQPSSPSAG